MDLNIIYSKTAKKSRLGSSLFGGLSSQLTKVLALVDGKSNAGQILTQLNEFTERKLALVLAQLEKEGYIKLVVMTTSDNDWLLASIFPSMVVEEINLIEELETKTEKETLLEAERRVSAEEKALMEDELKTREVVEQIHAKEKAKIEAKAGAKESARIAIERISHKAEETLKKAEAEALIKTKEKGCLEAERKAKLEAEREAQEIAEKIRAKEKDRREMVRLARKTEEARKKAEAEALTKAEEKARLEGEAEESAHIEMERIAHEAEAARKKAEALTKAEEKSRLEAEHNARLEANLKAELKAREDAEKIRLQVEAEERVEAEIEAKESARLETQRLADEAEGMQKITDAEALAQPEEEARFETERIAKVIAENKVRIKAEQRSLKEAERIAKKDEKIVLAIQKKAQQRADKRERTELKRLAREAKEEEARVSAYRKKLAGTRTLDIGEWIPKALKIMLLYLPLIVVLLVGLLHLINLSPLIKPIEKFVAESIGEPVTVNEVRASLWPQPHLLLGNVTVGANSGLKNEGLKIVSVGIFPVTSTLFEKVIVVKSLEIEGMKIGQDNFEQPLQWINSSSKAEHLKVEQINFKKIDLKIRDLELAPFDGEIVLGESREFKSINMNSADHALSVQVTPQGSSYNLALTAINWPLPVNPKIVFDEIKANGTLNQDQIDFSQIEGSIYGGNITAKALVSWSKQWDASGNFNLYKVSSSQILKAFDSGGSVDGKLDLKGSFSCKSDEAAKLADAADVRADFEIRNGKINGIELARAVLPSGDKSLAGDSTNFDKLTGSARFKGGHFQYRNLLLQTAQIRNKGNLDIEPSQDISGSISTDIVVGSRRLQTEFDLTGKVDNVKQQ